MTITVEHGLRNFTFEDTGLLSQAPDEIKFWAAALIRRGFTRCYLLHSGFTKISYMFYHETTDAYVRSEVNMSDMISCWREGMKITVMEYAIQKVIVYYEGYEGGIPDPTQT